MAKLQKTLNDGQRTLDNLVNSYVRLRIILHEKKHLSINTAAALELLSPII